MAMVGRVDADDVVMVLLRARDGVMNGRIRIHTGGDL
jgi:hypothetical protein